MSQKVDLEALLRLQAAAQGKADRDPERLAWRAALTDALPALLAEVRAARQVMGEIVAYWENDCEGCVSTDLIERAAALASPSVPPPQETGKIELSEEGSRQLEAIMASQPRRIHKLNALFGGRSTTGVSGDHPVGQPCDYPFCPDYAPPVLEEKRAARSEDDPMCQCGDAVLAPEWEGLRSGDRCHDRVLCIPSAFSATMECHPEGPWLKPVLDPDAAQGTAALKEGASRPEENNDGAGRVHEGRGHGDGGGGVGSVQGVAQDEATGLHRAHERHLPVPDGSEESGPERKEVATAVSQQPGTAPALGRFTFEERKAAEEFARFASLHGAKAHLPPSAPAPRPSDFLRAEKHAEDCAYLTHDPTMGDEAALCSCGAVERAHQAWLASETPRGAPPRAPAAPPKEEVAPLRHYAGRNHFAAACGADVPNQITTEIPSRVTCPDCKPSVPPVPLPEEHLPKEGPAAAPVCPDCPHALVCHNKDGCTVGHYEQGAPPCQCTRTAAAPAPGDAESRDLFDRIRGHSHSFGQARCGDCERWIQGFAARVRSEEREACARLAANPYGNEVDAYGPDEPQKVGNKIAVAIRARASDATSAGGGK